jgi:pseudaminic acid cytidylyltransferase
MKIAVIPARGGSKRIPRKNIRDFAGKPIIAYSILAARRSGLFDRIVVSTDDEEIAAISREWGAETPFLRPAELADDYTGTSDVVQHAVEWFQEQGMPVEYVCCIYATAPFLDEQFLCEAFQRFSAPDISYVFSVTSFAFPIQRAVKIDADGKPSFFQPEYMLTRSQDLVPAYHDAGQFCFGRATAFLKRTPIFGEFSTTVVIPRYLVEDIDTLEDWTRAELMYKVMSQGG